MHANLKFCGLGLSWQAERRAPAWSLGLLEFILGSRPMPAVLGPSGRRATGAAGPVRLVADHGQVIAVGS
jgi:hypothetical protein